MKEYFKSKFSKEKLAKFFDKEGFYIVLFLCVCIVAITAVWVSRTGVKNNENQSVTDVKENKPAVTVPSKETSAPGVKKVEEPKVVANEGSKTQKPAGKVEQEPKQESKKDAGSTTTKTETVASIKFDSPFKGGIAEVNVARGYSPTDLVNFEYLNEWRTHLGLDIKAPNGTEVLAVFDGKVVDIRNDNDFQGGLGWIVEVDHGNGYKSIYANLDEKMDVKKNQSLKKGQKIGAVGSSALFEKSTSQQEQEISHLHFEVLKKGAKAYENVDPGKYLTLQK